MWRGILLCLAIAAGDDAADVVDVPQQLMSAEKLRRIHQAVDKNKDGKVSVAEVVDFARHMNQVITSKEVQGILNELDKDQDGKLSWQEHLQDLHRFHDPPEDADEEMLKEFETRVAFEKEKFTAADVDKDHFLSPEEAVFLFLPETHPEVLDVVVNDIMKTKDKDADGYLSPQEMWEFSAQEGLSEEAMEDFQKLDKDGNHLLDAQDNLFGDWACIRTVLQEGQGFGCLTEGSEVEISIRAAAEDGRTLEERRSTPYKIGSGTLGDLSRVADKALEDMKKGSLVELRCEPQYAYGNTSHGEVTIRLEVHEVYMEEDVTPEKTGEVKKKQIKEGIGNDSPRDTAQVNLTVEVVRDSGGAVITCVGGPSEITFRAGDGQVCDALELAVLRMNQGERAMIYCNKPSMCTDPGLKLSLTEGEAIFTIELTSFQNPRNTYDMPEADKLKHAMERKETGSRLFREQRYFLALQRYRGVLDFFSFCENFSEAMKAQVKDLKKTCELNLSQCLLKLGDFYGAKVACDNVLSEEPHNLKALFRRASANLQRHDFSESLNDLKQLLELEPNNTEARRLLPQAQRGAKEGEKKARSMYAKMTKSLGTGREEVKGLQFNFEPKPEGFPALYLDAPGRNTASCNAGDYRLYVGGGAINRAFGDLFKKHQGLQFDKVCEEYKQMHLELLQASRKAGRKLVSAKDLPNAAALLPKLRLCASFGRAADVLPEEVQQNGDQQDLHELAGSTGSVFIDIFEEEQRPLSSRNVAMLYVVGPKGEGCVGPGEHAGPLLDEDRFLEMLENLATKAIETVAEYNDIRETACGSFVGPPIEEVRWCLVSGGVYRHANVSKVDVARITIIGMRAARGADGLVVTFAYDEDVFKKAWEIENKSSR